MNWTVRHLVRLGVSVWGARELRLVGRKSGQIRSNVVNLLPLDGEQYLVAPRGTTEWVRNLRAAGGGELRVGRRVESFEAAELADDAQAPGAARLPGALEVGSRPVLPGRRTRRPRQRAAPHRTRLPGLPHRRRDADLYRDAMPRHIAFLRAINVGERYVKMGRLRADLRGRRLHECRDVHLERQRRVRRQGDRRQEARSPRRSDARDALGFEVVTFIRSPVRADGHRGLRAVPARSDELPSGGRLPQVGSPEGRARSPSSPRQRNGDLLRVEGRELYWRPVDGIGRSLVSGAAIERALGPATVRNIGTVAKIAAKHPA